jgi:hypothetical protein
MDKNPKHDPDGLSDILAIQLMGGKYREIPLKRLTLYSEIWEEFKREATSFLNSKTYIYAYRLYKLYGELDYYYSSLKELQKKKYQDNNFDKPELAIRYWELFEITLVFIKGDTKDLLNALK